MADLSTNFSLYKNSNELIDNNNDDEHDYDLTSDLSSYSLYLSGSQYSTDSIASGNNVSSIFSSSSSLNDVDDLSYASGVGDVGLSGDYDLNNYDYEDNIFESTETESEESEEETAESLRNELNEIKEEQGLIGKVWDGIKNITGLGAGSNKTEKLIEQYEDGEITYEEAKEAITNYEDGQDMCVDVAGDMVSGIIAVGAFAAAVPTGGASLIAGLGIAAAAGAGSKIAVKAGDALLGGREYSGKDLLYDSATGAVNGLFAPVTNGIGASVTKTIGKKLGLTVVKEGTEEIIEQTAKQGIKAGIKSVITQEGVDVIGGTLAKRAAATAAGMAVDGALGGATDNMVRAVLDGEDVSGVLEAGVEGAVGGLILSPVIGGGFKIVGKAGKALNNAITTKSVFSDGMSTAFKQGDTGDCALLSFIDSAMNNDETSDIIKNSITKSVGGDYHVKIGNQTIDIPVSSLSDDILSDTTGVKLFELAYKKAGGSTDGEFAESVAKQFGLNPVHIASDSITDETLDNISKESGTILSFGTKIDADGSISQEGSNHYFSIRSVDSENQKVTLVNPYDTSKTFELSYDDVKKYGISIDGGTKGETSLPNMARSTEDISFKGQEVNYDILVQQTEIEPYELADFELTKYFQDEEGLFQRYLLVDDKEISLERIKKYLKKSSDGIEITSSADANPKHGIFDGGLKSGQTICIGKDGSIFNCSDSSINVKLIDRPNEDLMQILFFKSDDNICESICGYRNLVSLTTDEKLEKLIELIDDPNLYKYIEENLDNLSDSELSILLEAHESSSAIARYKNDANRGFRKINSTLEKLSKIKELRKTADTACSTTEFDDFVFERGVINDINSITDSIKKHTIPDGTRLYRRTDYEEFGELGIILKNLQEADSKDEIIAFLKKQISDPELLECRQSHFLSTSLGNYVENIDGSIELIMTTTNNTRGISILEKSQFNGKEGLEILLQRDSLLTIGSIDYNFDTKKWIISCFVSP